MSSPEKHVVIDIPDGSDATSGGSESTDYDNQVLHRVIEDAGRWAFGIVIVELWVLNDTSTRLFRPEAGWWLDKYASSYGRFARFTDPSSPDFVQPEPLAPGVGLPGYLWSQSRRDNPADGLKTKGHKSNRLSAHSSDAAIRNSERFDATRNRADILPRQLAWCELRPLANDPDQPHNPRLKIAAEVGLGLAAGVPFNLGGTQGIVIYMARPSVNITKLASALNVEYLQRATMLIGSAYSLRKARLAVAEQRKGEARECFKRVVKKMKQINKMNKKLDEVVHEESQRPPQSFAEVGDVIIDMYHDAEGLLSRKVNFIVLKLHVWARKCLGAQNKGPPGFSWNQALFTLIGCLATLAILTNINKALTSSYGADYSIVLPPFGALMTLQYGLTAAPASQPRNAIVGQTLALCIARGIGEASNVELWVRQTIATSLAIAVMVKFGVTHPPAGAAALVFSSGEQSWIQVGIMLMGNVVAIVCATAINNWNKKRQYPTFWGLRPIIQPIIKMMNRGNKKEA